MLKQLKTKMKVMAERKRNFDASKIDVSLISLDATVEKLYDEEESAVSDDRVQPTGSCISADILMSLKRSRTATKIV
jgi:hypothetical protein